MRDQRGQATNHVDEVPGELVEESPLAGHLVAGAHPDQRREDRHERKGQHDDEGGEPVLGRDRDDREQGEDGREQQRRQVARQVGLDRRHAARRKDRQRADPVLGEVRGPEPAGCTKHCATQLPTDGGGRVRRCAIDADRHSCSGRHDDEEHLGRLLPARLVDQCHDESGDRERLSDHQQRRERAAEGHDEQRSAGDAHVGEDSGVHGPHA